MKKILTVLSLLAMVVGLQLLIFGDLQAAEPIKLTYANFPPANTFPCVQMERWKQEVEKRTNGKVSIQTFPGGTLLDAKNMMDGVIAGQANIGCLSMSYQPGRFLVTNALSLSLNIKSALQGSLALWDFYNKYKPEEFSKVKVLTMFTTAPANIMSTIPIKSLNDLKGVPLRASGGAGDILKLWGANMVGMPMTDTPEALQKGVVKGLFSSLEVLMDFKFAEQCKYATITNAGVYPFAVVMNMETWNKLPDDVKKVMDDMAREQAEWTGKYMDDHVLESIEWSKKNHGLQVIEIPQEELKKWHDLLEPINNKWVEDAKAKGLPAEKMLADLKELVKKYEK
ncbi:MAG: TRAP transporter substrate-binding protein [Desulfatiglandales bacterium]